MNKEFRSNIMIQAGWKQKDSKKKKTNHVNIKQIKKGMSILISDSVDFKQIKLSHIKRSIMLW